MQIRYTAVLLCCLFFAFSSFAQFKNEDELKKQAAQYFEDEDYANGFRLYSQLVSNYPKDAEYNYRLGVCMLYADPDKKKPIPYLRFAVQNIKDAEKEAYFYLGKAYHLNFRFDDAIQYYNLYKQNGSSSMQKKLQVDHEMQSCKNGKRLLSNLQELVVLDKKQLSQAEYFRSYDLKDIGGKLLVKPPDFISAQDKKKKDKSIVYLPASKDQLYYASYGEKGDNKDIYIVRRMPDGSWGKPENLGAPVNTEFDEDYPFLHPNGTVLYFASKGHNTMGGYDIFKSEYDEASRKWKEPVNLDFPINSPNDDILFVTDSLEKIAFLSSTRQSPWGKIDVFKILTERRPAEYAFIKGTVVKKKPDQSVQSKIKVKNMETGEDAGTFDADPSGEYSIKLSNGGKFIFTVETPDFPTQSEGVTIPTAYNYKPYKQVIEYDDQKLKITNFFDTNDKDENNYVQYLQLIEEKSRMDVNAGDFDINPNNPVVTNNPKNPSENKNQTTTENNTSGNAANTNATGNENSNPTKSNLSNQELVKMAYDDAKELQQGADSLKKDAATAFSAANSKQDQANEKKQELQDLQNQVAKETNPVKKQELNDKVEKAKEEADLYSTQATTANNIAKQMEVDAVNKQKEADLNNQYAKALEEAEKTKNNKEALAKLEDLQKQLETASQQKSQSNNLVESIKADAQNKEQELKSAEAKQAKIDDVITELKTQLSDLDKQQSETKDKDLIENIKAQKDEVNTDLAEKEKESQINKNKIATLKEESDALRSQAEYASNVLAGNPNAPIENATASNNASSENNPESNSTSGQASNTATDQFAEDSKKYADQLAELNSPTNSLDDNKKKADLITQYETLLDKEIKDKKQELQKSKNKEEKAALNNTIKELTEKKNELQKDSKVVSTKIKEQEKQTGVAATNTVTTNSVATNNQGTGNETNPAATNTVSTVGNEANSSGTSTVDANNNPTGNESSATNNPAGNENPSSAGQDTGNETASSDPRIQSVNTLLNESNNNLNEEKKVFEGLSYSNPKAQELKKQADEKFNAVKKNNEDINSQLGQIKSELEKQDQAGNEQKIAAMSKQADDFSAQSFKLRQDAKNLTGSEKQNAMDKILDLDKQASELRYESARLQYQSDDNTYASNKVIIDQLEQQSKNKQSAEIQQARDLAQQADKIKNEAARLRKEAEAEPSIEARTGALSNADEKEKEALVKQNEVLALLKKVNPQATTSVAQGDANKQIEDVKSKLAKETQADNNALKLLSEANKAEYNAGLKDYLDEAKKTGAGYDAQEFMNKAAESYKAAEADLAKLNSTKEENARRDLNLSANRNLEEAIKQIRNAKQALNGAVASNETGDNTNTENANQNTGNETNPANTNTVAVTNNPNTENPVSTNTVATNSNQNTVNETNPVATNTVSANSNQGANENNQVASNTVTPTSGQMTPERVKEIKNSEPYQKYTLLQNTVSKYNDAAAKDEQKAKEENQRAGQLKQEAAAMPEGPAKKQKEQEAQISKQRADSMQELASNTRALAESKKQELDDYNQSLDANTMNDVLAVSNQNTTSNQTSAPTKYSDYSENYRTNAVKMDDELSSLRNQTSNSDNLKQQNTIIDSYLANIDAEVAAKKKQQAATPDQAEKSKLAQQIKNLQTRKIELSNEKSTNENIMKFASGTNNTAANNNPSSNNPAANNNQTAGNENNTTANNTAANTNAATGNAGNVNEANNTTANNTAANNTPTNNAPRNNGTRANTPAATSASYLNTTGFEIKNGNAYSAANPIPVDEKLPSGLLFRVQIGAFRNPIPADNFKGLAPVGAENTPQGFMRYQVGMFNKFQTANSVKNDMRNLGYRDAFVVAYRDGKRISLGEALDSLLKKGENITADPNATAGISANNNVPLNTEIAPASNEAPVTASELNATNGLLFTVQIGVYNSAVGSSRLLNLSPVYKESIPGGMFRYTAGVYNNLDRVKADRAKVNVLGIADAFVSAYLNGQRIKISDATEKIAQGNVQLMSENPIVFPQGGAPANIAPANNNSPAVNTVQPFTNGVSQGPAPTPENGVKTSEEGITYKVQIGAYSKQIPVNIADNWMKIKTWPISYSQINNLYIYTVGSFSEARFAKKLKDEMVALGITDAFVIVLKDGKKLYGTEASQYLNR
jgi:hypothetical protein